jgi:hypothetical protein
MDFFLACSQCHGAAALVNTTEEDDDTEEDDEAEQHMEDAGVFGGNGCCVSFYGVLEGCSCLWMALLACYKITGVQPLGPALTIFILGSCLLTCLSLHCFMFMADPFFDFTGVGAILQSLEEDILEDEQTANIFKKLRDVPATVKVAAMAYHTVTVSHSNGTRTATRVMDHIEEANFSYASWKDVSGRVAGLDEYKIAAVEVVAKIKCHGGDGGATDKSLQSLKQQVLDTCQGYVTPGKATQAVPKADEISLKLPEYGVDGSRVFVTCSTGEDSAWWMNKSTYTACRLAFAGTAFRILLFTSMANVRYTITKCISVTKQQGDGWNEYKDV